MACSCSFSKRKRCVCCNEALIESPGESPGESPVDIVQFLAFGVDTTLSQPVAGTENDLPHPNLSLDVRLDAKLTTSEASRVVFSVHNDSTGSREVTVQTNTTATQLLFIRGNNSGTLSAVTGFWEFGQRHQYRFVWNGTSAEVYKRDPATFNLPLADNTNWTLADSNVVVDIASNLPDNPNTALHLMRRLSGDGWSAWDLYEFLYYVDGVAESHIDGNLVGINTAANTLDDEILGDDKWTWTGTDPTVETL